LERSRRTDTEFSLVLIRDAVADAGFLDIKQGAERPVKIQFGSLEVVYEEITGNIAWFAEPVLPVIPVDPINPDPKKSSKIKSKTDDANFTCDKDGNKICHSKVTLEN